MVITFHARTSRHRGRAIWVCSKHRYSFWSEPLSFISILCYIPSKRDVGSTHHVFTFAFQVTYFGIWLFGMWSSTVSIIVDPVRVKGSVSSNRLGWAFLYDLLLVVGIAGNSWPAGWCRPENKSRTFNGFRNVSSIMGVSLSSVTEIPFLLIASRIMKKSRRVTETTYGRIRSSGQRGQGLWHQRWG